MHDKINDQPGVSDAIKHDIMGIIRKYLDLSRYDVFVFGSRASGKGDDRSDIDIGIEGAQPVDRAILGHIREDVVNLPTLYKIDVVDFVSASSQFREVAKQHIEYLNRSSSSV